jgi:hypothetical protein
MVAVVAIELWQSTATNPAVTYPSGFSEIVNVASSTDGFQKLKLALKVLTAADSGTYSMSWTGTHFNQAQCSLWSGVDTTNPQDVAAVIAQVASGTAFPSTSLTTAHAGCGMLHVVANENSSTSTPPTGYTEQQEANYLKTNSKIAGAAGSESISGGGLSTSTLQLAALIALRPASSGNSQTITPAAETDTGVAPARSRAATVTPAAETDTAQTPARARAAAVTSAGETDTALAPGRSKTVTPAGETDVAITPGHPGGTAITPAAETDTGVTPGRTRAAPTLPATETDVPVSPGRSRTRTVTPAQETDVPVTPAAARAQAITPATEVDVAVDVHNPNEVLRDLDLVAVIEPGRFRVMIEPARFTAETAQARFRTEIES